MLRRIAKEFARIEKNKFDNPLTEDEIFEYLDRFKYICVQGSPAYGIGNDYQTVSISNCFVVQTLGYALAHKTCFVFNSWGRVWWFRRNVGASLNTR